jgi:hypothetical protein
MTKKQSFRNEAARDILASYPTTAKAALARKLYKEKPELFVDVEDARRTLREVTGANGTKRRKNMPAAEVKPNDPERNPYALPKQKHNDNKPNIIPHKAGLRLGLVSDIHIPYQDNAAVTTALDYLKGRGIDILYLNGDIMDCYQISSFEKDPTKCDFGQEIEMTKQFLRTLVKEFPGVKIYFKEGNHEARFTMFLRRKAPELLGIEVLSLRSLLELDKLGIHYVPSKVISHFGKLPIFHGHEFAKGFAAPVNPARGFFIKSKSNGIGGHHHQDSSHSENTLDGKQLVCYSTGHLADPHPEYHPHNNWSQGFADITIHDDAGNFDVTKYKIINGRIVNS